MPLVGYAAFWLAALSIFLVVFDLLYGRHVRKLMRMLLGEDTPDDQRSVLMERIHQAIANLREAVKR